MAKPAAFDAASGERRAIEQTIETGTHGRYLTIPAAVAPAPLLVGFHGYAEPAEMQLDRLRIIPGSERWTIVAVQGLHRFYNRRDQQVIASWMTRQDRELAMDDNRAYIAAVVDTVWTAQSASGGAVFTGFSQGVAMAFRAATASNRPIAGVIAVGGDVPPELDRGMLARLGHVLICRGVGDEWYTTEKFEADQTRLRGAGLVVTALEFDGGHEWSAAVVSAASAFLAERR